MNSVKKIRKKSFYISLTKSSVYLVSVYFLFSSGYILDDLAGDFLKIAALGLALSEGISIYAHVAFQDSKY